jgi:oligopeptide/dipeptide ABC transporter ATP-binding protein
MPDTLLEIEQLQVNYHHGGPALPGVTAVREVSLKVHAGQIVGLVGETGSGKSTVCLAIMRLLPENALVKGKILALGKDLLQLNCRDLCRVRGKQIAIIFQDVGGTLNPYLRIQTQVDEVLRRRTSLNRQQRKERIERLLRSVNFAEPKKILHSYPHQLSGGMKQRVMIAMAIACEPALLIADEPTTALDVCVQKEVLELLTRLVRGRSTNSSWETEAPQGLLVVSHDFGVIGTICDYVYVLYAGVVLEQGPVKEVFRSPLHPYTRGLVSVIPRLRPRQQARLPVIEGQPVSAGSAPAGCPFWPRCAYQASQCLQLLPPLREVGDMRAIRCWMEIKME